MNAFRGLSMAVLLTIGIALVIFGIAGGYLLTFVIGDLLLFAAYRVYRESGELEYD